MQNSDISTLVSELQTDVNGLLEAHVFPVLQKKTSAQTAFFTALESQWEATTKGLEKKETITAGLLKSWHTGWQELSEGWQGGIQQPDTFELQVLFPEFSEVLEPFFHALPWQINREQLPERFQRLPEDQGRLRLQKAFKRFSWHLSRFPVRFSNLFRKEKKRVSYWQQVIPFKSLLEDRLRTALIEGLAEVLDTLHHRRSQYVEATFQRVLERDQRLAQIGREVEPAETATEEVPKEPLTVIPDEALFQNMETLLLDKVKAAFEQITEELKVVNTLEFPLRWLSESKLAKRRKEETAQFQQRVSGAFHASKNNLRKAEYESWLHRLAMVERSWHFDFSHRIQPRFFTPLLEFQSELIGLLNEMKEAVGREAVSEA